MGNKKLGVVGIFLFLIIGFIFIINSNVVKNVSGLPAGAGGGIGPSEECLCVGCSSPHYCAHYDYGDCDCCMYCCDNVCTVGNTRCDGNILQTCQKPARLCSDWSFTADCADSGKVCSNGQCVTTCTPDCSCESTTCVGSTCSNGCGGTCDGILTPDCGSRVCGPAPNGCGNCGTCSSGYSCSSGSCCTPDCLGKECGSDGCGGSCSPGCDSGEVCSNGQCHNAICHVTNVPTSNDTLVMGLSGLSNAHGELNSSHVYDYGLYCNFPGDNSSGRLMYLSSSTNAHAEAPDVTTREYSHPVYYSGFYSCRSTNGSCSTQDNEIDVIHLSSGTNAHIGNTFNDFDNFNRRICCTLNITEPVGTCNHNGNCDAGEECDGNNFCGETCETQGYSGGGNLICNNCVINTSGCVGEQGPNAYWADNDNGNKITQKEFSIGNKVKLIIENETGSGNINLLVSETNGYNYENGGPLEINAIWSSNKYVGTWIINNTAINWFKAYPGPFNLTFTSQENFPGLTSSPLNLSIIIEDKYCSFYKDNVSCNSHINDPVANRSDPLIGEGQSCANTGGTPKCSWNDSNGSCQFACGRPYPHCDESDGCWLAGNHDLCLFDTCECKNGGNATNGCCDGESCCNESYDCWLAGDLCNGTSCKCLGTINKPTGLGTCTIGGTDIDLGNCTYFQFGDDNCDDGSLTSNWTATWTWVSGNEFASNSDCETEIGKTGYCINDTRGDNKYHYDPFKKSLDCKKGSSTVPCPAQMQLGFFDNYNFLTVIVLIFVIYYLWSSKKKNGFLFLKKRNYTGRKNLNSKKKSSKRVKKKK